VVIIAKPEPRLNEEITCPSCRLIDYEGNQLGVYQINEALRVAEEAGYDLVEIAPEANPPVCRVMNYGKFKYEQAMKAKQAKKNQTRIEVKEMKFRPKIDVGDYETKKRHVIRFLNDGNKVKITIMFRGREMAHPEQGISILERLADDLAEIAVVESSPIMEGRNMHMTISPSGKVGTKKQATMSRKAQKAEKQRQQAAEKNKEAAKN
jgi:translation initiation factor IF-3